MAYNLEITEHTDQLIERLTGYLIQKLHNVGAALHFQSFRPERRPLRKLPRFRSIHSGTSEAHFCFLSFLYSSCLTS